MSIAATLTAQGGLASYAELRRAYSRRAIRAALTGGSIIRSARGRYALAAVEEHRRLAHRHTAVRSHLSAAQAHGWKVKDPPQRAWLTVPRGRTLTDGHADIAHFSWVCLTPAERRVGITSPLRTVLDCARALPFEAALTVADQALRTEMVGLTELRLTAHRARGPGSGAIRRVARHADGRAANPFESVLRAIVCEIPDLRWRL